MARVFYPRASRLIPASSPHPEGTEYKISVGDEEWEGVFHQVVKVQMVYNGKVAGRKSPSYPVGTDDWRRVADAIGALLREQQQSSASQGRAKEAARLNREMSWD